MHTVLGRKRDALNAHFISEPDKKKERALIHKCDLALIKAKRPSYVTWQESAEDDDVVMGYLDLKDPGTLIYKLKDKHSRFAVFRTRT
jgi:hypothetical protein